MLYEIVISPIERIIEFVFAASLSKFGRSFLAPSIFAVSLAVNFLALPIYLVADALQAKERELQKSFAPALAHFKATFSGDERYMMVQTFYRQQKYHPIFALRSSLSILIQAPFFIAAYHFLSNCEALKGASFWILRDLGCPDGLLKFGTAHVNFLPVLMTAINCASAAIYTRGFPLREKAQTFALSAIFLVLLYNSPSGLVFYWILNQIFSLCKNIAMKAKNPAKILYFCLCAIFFAIAAFFLFKSSRTATFKKAFTVAVAVFVALLPAIARPAKKLLASLSRLDDAKFRGALFALSAVALWLLTGFYLPSNLISSSPEEFSFLGKIENPVFYVKSAATFFFGLFVFWPLSIYKMFGAEIKKAFALIFSAAALCALANATIFALDWGILNVVCKMDDASALHENFAFFALCPAVFFAALCAALCASLGGKKFAAKIPLHAIFLVLSIAFCFAGAQNCAKICKKFSSIKEAREKNAEDADSPLKKVFHFSKTGKNVCVLFIDRAISSYFPYICQKNPNIERQFGGFTYFPNTMSFGQATNVGAPPLFGGYEFSPEKINSREIHLKDEQNAALLQMPRLFSGAGFSVTVTDVPYPNYRDDDLSIFASVPNCKAESLIRGRYYGRYCKEFFPEMSQELQTSCLANTKSFAFLQIFPPVLRQDFYKSGAYYHVSSQKYGGNMKRFVENYSVLTYLPKIVHIDEAGDNFSIFGCEVAHAYTRLNPDYEPNVTKGVNLAEPESYQGNVAALKKLGGFFDFLRQSGVWDNTRIVVVADHSYKYLASWGDYVCPEVVSGFNPLLLFKDFGSDGGISLDNSFMTNADTLFLAKKGLDVSNISPFSGEILSDEEKKEGVSVYCCDWRTEKEAHNTKFPLEQGWLVKENIFDAKNWQKIKD